MKKREMAFAAAVLIIIMALTGCGTGEESTPAQPDGDSAAAEHGAMADFYAEQLESQAQEAEIWAKAPNDAEAAEEAAADEEIVMASYSLTGLHPFSEGRAWVEFADNGTICTGIIDTTGKLLYRADSKYWYVSQFTDGYAIYRENRTENSPCGIIDLNGNATFTSQIKDDGGYLILGYGNGHFLAAQHIRNFETDEWRYGTIDQRGNILNEMKGEADCGGKTVNLLNWIGHEKEESYVKYIGENFIALPYSLYNISDGYFSATPLNSGSVNAAGNFYEGYTILLWAASVSQDVSAFVIDTNYFNRGHNNNSEEYYLEDYRGIISKKYIADHYSIAMQSIKYSEGLIWVREDNGYCDKDWNLVISMNPYKDVMGGAFRGGKAAVTMEGVDGERYVSVIDREGSLLYPPIRATANPANAANGYFQVEIGGEEKIIGPDGTIYTPGMDDLSAIGDASFGSISDGFMICDNTYVSLDAERVIDSARIVSGGTGSGGEGAVSNIMLEAYIEGTWKSIGESGFGQAQPGALVAFDGVYCNFYSPSDIYAFYYDGSEYVLDVAGALGDSLNFTVKIIDDDRMDIYYGSDNVTELKRVD